MSRTEYVSGDLLTPEDRQLALDTYVLRYTGSHTPDWAREAWAKGTEVQYADDAEWLRVCKFPVKDGRLTKGHVLGVPTFPNKAKVEKVEKPPEINQAMASRI